MSFKKRVMSHGSNQHTTNYCSVNLPSHNIGTNKAYTEFKVAQETTPLVSNSFKLVKCHMIKAYIVIFTLIVVSMILIYNANLQNSSNQLQFSDANKVGIGSKCTGNITNCNGHGKCVNVTNVCECNYGYTTHNAPDNSMCNYKQKRQLKAFLLTLFLGGFGAGRFYVGWYATGVIKLAEILTGCIISCYIGIFTIKERGYDTSVCCSALPLICATLGVSTWIILDIIFFGMNMIADENGVKLASMF